MLKERPLRLDVARQPADIIENELEHFASWTRPSVAQALEAKPAQSAKTGEQSDARTS